jgi:hypothetical protein
MNHAKTRAALAAIALLASACGTATSAGIDEAEDAASAPASAAVGEAGDASTDAASAVLAAGWADHVTITINADTFTFASDGLPSHEVLDQYLADGPGGKYIAGGVSATSTTIQIPLVATMAATPADTGLGAIGVAVSGAVFFNPYEGDGTSTVANDDNSSIDGIPFLDACGGHPLPNASAYHYHGIPFCITDALDTEGQHSEVIGYLLDGFAIYGPQGVDGTEPTDLDACMGHTGTVPGATGESYHYHVSVQANYISACLSGSFTASGPGGPA